jgi:hypothetical protein
VLTFYPGESILGDWEGEFTCVPIPMAVSGRKKIDPELTRSAEMKKYQ